MKEVNQMYEEISSYEDQIKALGESIEKESDFQASLTQMNRATLIEKARAWDLKVNGVTPSKNNKVEDLRAALLAHSNDNLGELIAEQAFLMGKLKEAKRALLIVESEKFLAENAGEQTQESEPEHSQEETSAEIGATIVVDMINPARGYHKLETPYILKIIANYGVEIYFKDELIDSASSIKAARQKVGHHAGPWTLPEGYEVRRETKEGAEYMTA